MEAAVRWSPHSTSGQERFLVVDVTDQSLTLHQVDDRKGRDIRHHVVTRHARLPNFGAFDWSRTDESIVAVGALSGTTSLVKLYDDDRPSEIVANYRLKQQRKCNSIALSSQNWLAVALDKTRSDNCLNVYDINGDHQGQQDAIRRLCPAELVTSVRFFPRQPQEVAVAAQRSSIRLYDLRDGYFASNSSLQVATRNVNNIAIDPADENYFASSGSTDDPSISVWDKRWIAQGAGALNSNSAVFEFRPAVENPSKTTIWSIKYSGRCRGRLALCSSAGEMKVIDMVEGQSSILHGSEYLPANAHGGASWSCNRYVSKIRSLEKAHHGVLDRSDRRPRLIAFDWIYSDEAYDTQRILALRPDRAVDVLPVNYSTAHAQVTARHDLGFVLDDVSMIETKPMTDTPLTQTPYSQDRAAEDFGPQDYRGEAAASKDGADTLALHRDSSQLSSLLTPYTIQRERCLRGYLFDYGRNIEIVAGDWPLERLWEIVDRFRETAADDGMVSESLDLSFVGVCGLWSEIIDDVTSRRVSPSPQTIADAIVSLNASREIPAFEGERTNFPEHRQLCLAVCGWKFTPETLEAECQELIERGLYYQAIVQAVLHEHKHIALNLLRTLIRSKTVPNIGLGPLLASDMINEEQREMCLWMAADTEDPALKALLTFLTTNDWRDIMKTNYLHLDYRVALGLKYLNDTELSGFIQSETARAVQKGDLEGLLLTGLGTQAMDLLQNYMIKSNDLQSAVLATAFTYPVYMKDIRWEMWKETYFLQMQAWRAFNQRTHFVVKHSQMARTRDGRRAIEPPPGQITLRCNHCQTSLTKYNGDSLVPQPNNNRSSNRATTGVAENAGIICPNCKRNMPRCGICKLWLGTPDPTKPGGMQELQKLSDVMDKFLTFCVRCGHGFHASHAKSWFEKHKICPLPDCQCMCAL